MAKAKKNLGNYWWRAWKAAADGTPRVQLWARKFDANGKRNDRAKVVADPIADAARDALAAAWYREHVASNYTPTRKTKRAKKETFNGNTLADVFERWIAYRQSAHESERLNQRSVDVYRQRFELYVKPLLATMAVDAIDAKAIESIKREFASISPRTINNTIRMVLAVLKWAASIGLRDDPPSFGKRAQIKSLAEPGEKIDFWDADEIDDILREAESRGAEWHATIRLLIDAGLRPSEACGLRWVDVRLTHKNPHILVRHQLLRDGLNLGPCKHRKPNDPPRRVPLTRALVSVLTELHTKRGKTGYEFVLLADHPSFDKHTRACNQQTLARRFRIVVEAATGSKLNSNPHNGRHAFGTTHARIGTNLKTLQKMMGHRSLAVTIRYLHATANDENEAIANVDTMRQPAKRTAA